MTRGLRSLFLSVLTFLAIAVGAGGADARITIRPHSDHDNFFFHASYSKEPFDPSTSFGLQVWNCGTGAMPTFVADREPIIVCLQAGSADIALAELAYTVEIPGGSCIDHGRSCYYRNPDVDFTSDGVRYFRVQYSRRGRGNRVWLESYGDLSAATQANMMIVITVDGTPRAVLTDTFTPLGNGGWFSHF
jgi:hypothetical protein